MNHTFDENLVSFWLGHRRGNKGPVSKLVVPDRLHLLGDLRGDGHLENKAVLASRYLNFFWQKEDLVQPRPDGM